MKKHLDREWLQREWIERHRLLRDIAAECGVSKQAVQQQAEKVGLKYLHPAERIDVSWLREQVEGEGRAQADIGREVGLSGSRISILCCRHGIKRPRQTKEERAARQRYYQNTRYRTDPEYRAMKKATAARWRKEHPAPLPRETEGRIR